MNRSIFTVHFFSAALCLAKEGAAQTCAFTIGGAVYANCNDPIGSSVSGVRVCVSCVGGFTSCGESGLGLGIWLVAAVPCGECTVCVEEDATHSWQHVTERCGADCEPCTTIQVDRIHQAANQNIQFVSPPADLDGDHDVDLADYAVFIDCRTGPEHTERPGNCELSEFARSDLDGDGDVDLEDYAAFQRTFCPL